MIDESTINSLDFNDILNMAALFSMTAPGASSVRVIRPLLDAMEIDKRLDMISECREIITGGGNHGIEHFDDLTIYFKRLRPEDSLLDPMDLKEFLPFLDSVVNLKKSDFIKPESKLAELISSLIPHESIKRDIERSIDKDGGISDNASPALAAVRQSIRACENKIKHSLDKVLKRKELTPHIQEQFITGRNNRWVIPVKNDSKGHIPGVIHDISNTGETVFVEPFETLSFGNEAESLRSEEKLEEFRVLKRLSALLRDSLHEIENNYRIISVFDTIHALSLFAESMEMTRPEMNSNGSLKINAGRHPLLFRSLKRSGKIDCLVPLDIELGVHEKSIVITGPNMGGKTVALKSVGVFTLMALSGMHLPAESGTTVPFLNKIFIDIGDEQSIDGNRSTFSSHMKNIADILESSGRDTLVLIDEFGTGTDPDEGGALACAVLKDLTLNGALTVVTTHLSVLKAYAHKEPGILNCSMGMETVNLDGQKNTRPVYKLVAGQPGSSHAFEIASGLGLPANLISRAKELMSRGNMIVESLISDLNRKKSEYDQALEKTVSLKEELITLKNSMIDELSVLRKSRREALARGYGEAEKFLLKARREAEEIVRKIKVSDKSTARQNVGKIDKNLKEVRNRIVGLIPEKRKKLVDLQEGERVYLKSLGCEGELLSKDDRKEKCTVLIKGRYAFVPFSDLYEVDGSSKTEGEPPLKGSEMDAKMSLSLPGEINIIGKRVDPAITDIEKYLNDAVLADASTVRIVHGVGAGILSRAVSDYLTGHPLVKEFEKEGDKEGREAVTIVYL